MRGQLKLAHTQLNRAGTLRGAAWNQFGHGRTLCCTPDCSPSRCFLFSLNFEIPQDQGQVLEQ
jgi:hypothetical protein